ncbi:MAG: copper resistance protein CopC, partial [Candidatus Thermoplasmatota archaeon]
MEAWIEFTQPPDPAGSGLELLDANLTPVGGGVFALEGDRMTLQLPPALPSGGYVLRWVALSASDGHTTKGNIPFAIGQASAPEVATLDAEQAPSLLAILGKSLLYLGLTLTIGMLAFHMWVTPSSHHAWWRASLFAGGVAAF